jgi:hypothetical protein
MSNTLADSLVYAGPLAPLTVLAIRLFDKRETAHL